MMADNNSNGAAAPASSAEPVAGPSVKDILDFDPFEPASAGQGGAQAPAPADEPVERAEGDALPPSGGQVPSQQPPQGGAQAPGGQAPDPVLRALTRIDENSSVAHH